MRLHHSTERRHRFSGKKLLATAAVALLLTGAGSFGYSLLHSKTVDAGDCTGNSIVHCGSSNRQDLINTVRGNAQLQAIYAHFGLNASDYNRFVTSARPGMAYASNNTIVVDGRVVATNVWSIGRWSWVQGAGYWAVPIAGVNYYGNYNNKAFASTSTAIPVDVLFDQTGKMQFAVMTSACGNPATGTPVQPTEVCRALNMNPTNQADTYNFTTDASATNGAVIDHLVYNFGDGSNTVTTTNPAQVVTHHFTRSAEVSVTVYVRVPGGGIVVLTNCKHQVTVIPPATVACTNLALTPGKADEQGNVAYTLAATASAKNATIKGYTFYFGDKTATKTVDTKETLASVAHVYKPGTYTAHVEVTAVDLHGKTVIVGGPNCQKQISFTVPAPVVACDSLTLTAGTKDEQGNTAYTLTATASAQNATITGYRFSFGDNAQPQTVATANTTASTTHTYAPGSYTASVTVTATDLTGKTITVSGADCAKPVNVAVPECQPGVPMGSPQCYTYSCDLFTVTKGDNRTVTVSDFKSSSTNTSVAEATSVVVDWGDNGQAQSFAPASSVKGATHTYAATGNDTDTYNIVATAHFNVNGTDEVASGNCAQTVSYTTPPTPPTPPAQTSECRPGVATGSPMCTPCQYNAAIPASDTNCVKPAATLVNTGAGSNLGIFAAVTILAAFGHRLFLSRRLARQ